MPRSPDGLLLFDSKQGARLYDPATGELVRTVLPALDREQHHYHAFTRSRHLLAFPNTEGDREGGVAMLYDLAGNEVARFPSLGRDDNEVLVSPATPIALYRDRLHIRVPLVVHDLTGRSPNVLLFRPDLADSDFRLEHTRFSADGTRATVSYWARPDIRTSYMDVYDLRTGKSLGKTMELQGWPDRGVHGFINRNELLLSSRGDGAARTTTIDIRAVNGTASRQLVVASPGIPIREPALSDDGTLLASYEYQSRAIEIRDTRTANLVASRPTPLAVRPVFFPGSHRLLMGEASTRGHVVADPYHVQPLAILPLRDGWKLWPQSVISPDGQTIVVSADPLPRTVAIYGRTGWDCPESHLGALAFPHVWVLGVLLTAAVVSAAGDARRARVDSSSPPPGWLPYALILVALPVTLYFIIAAALGRWTVNPAPVLLIAGIGLLTHSRLWRLLTVVLLAGTLGWCIYLLNAVRLAGVKQSSLYPLLDREYVVPHVLPAVGLGVTIALCAAALYVLARRARVQGLAAPAS